MEYKSWKVGKDKKDRLTIIKDEWGKGNVKLAASAPKLLEDKRRLVEAIELMLTEYETLKITGAGLAILTKPELIDSIITNLKQALEESHEQ